MRYNYLRLAGVLLALFIVAGIVGQADYEDAQREEERYCDSVAQYKHTHGELGHPPYNGEEFCAKYTVDAHSTPR